MKPCFGYVRVSTVRQGDGASLEAQKDAITGFASQNNLEIKKWFEEQETASKTGRPVFGSMLHELRDGQAEGLIIHKIDRSSRNYSDWARLSDVAELGIKVYFAADSLDFDTRGGRLLADIQMALAADYSRNLSQEVKKGIYGRVKQGIYPFRAPIGYLNAGGGNLKVIDPIKAPLVKKLFELYASGEYSITSLTEEMRRRGLTGYGGRPVVRRNVETILKSPFFCGKMRVGGKLYSGGHEPLISAATFRRVQAVKSRRHGKKSTKQELLFRGLFVCGECSGTVTGERQKQRVYYRCHTKGCPAMTIREDRLEVEIVRKLSGLQISIEDQDKIAQGLQIWLKTGGTEEIETSLKLRIAETRARQDRLMDLLVDGAINKDAYQLRKENFEFDLQHLREELTGLERQCASREDYEQLLELATDLVPLYQASLPPFKRRLIKNCLENRRTLGGGVSADPARWLLELPKFAESRSEIPDGSVFSETVRKALVGGLV